jgi:3-oxoacyl-[acyl-carrier protein] reductase
MNQPLRLMPGIKDIKASAMEMGLKDKVVLITGSSRGIGETIAKLLALYGAWIIVNFHRGKDDADRIVQEIQAEGGNAIAIQADVTRIEQVRRMVAEAKNRYGVIHVLVNNAVRDFRPIPFLNLTWDEIQLDLDVIAKGAFHCCRKVIPLMLEAGGGKIINIASVAVDNPPPDQAKYVLAKSALVGLTRSLSVEFAARNIQVNLVVPSFVDTDLVSHIQEGFRKKIAQDSPMQRHASPVEVAQAVLFLASSHASFTTGQKIMVTGGGAPFL